MKTLHKLIAVAAAFGMAPVMAAAPAPSAPAPAAAAPAPAGPAAASQNGMQASEAPANAQVAAPAWQSTQKPSPTIGQPDGRAELQEVVTPIGQEARWFHNMILMPLIIIISFVVLGLLLWVIVRYRQSANPVPSRNSHNTVLEIVWTVVPVVILVAIAIPSIRLLAHQYSPPKADLTIKATGNQWYWTYTYPDNGGFELVSNMLPADEAKKRGEPRLLAVDERMVVPAGATVKMIVTAADVIHSWGVPAFWVKMDAVPGRLNETWFKVTDRPGIYYGQCFELCGARHGFMPISVEVVPPAQFAAWIASKGGTMPGAVKPTSPDATQNSPILNPGAAANASGDAAPATPEPTNVSAGTATAPVTNQSQATSSRGN